MIFRLALRQIWSHKKRSIITLLLSLIATFTLVFTSAFSDGQHEQIVKSAVEVYPGYIEVANRDFEDNPNFDNLIFDIKAIEQILKKDNRLYAYSPRFETFALYSTKIKTIGGLFCAIRPESEANITRLKESLVAGEYLSSDDTNALYMGVELASRFNLHVGDKLSFISTGADYSFAADNLYVKGLFKTNLFSFDNSAAFMNKSYFDKIMMSDNIATKIIIKPTNLDNINKITKELNLLMPQDINVRSYYESMKDLIKAMEVDEFFGYFSIGILFSVIFFVIAIFAYLSIYARVREIGVLRAIGTTPLQVVKLLFYEALILGSISVSLGGLGGGYLAYYFNLNPISLEDMSGGDKESQKMMEDTFKQYDFVVDTTIPTAFKIDSIIRDILIMLILNIMTVIYPIISMNRYTPIQALRYV